MVSLVKLRSVKFVGLAVFDLVSAFLGMMIAVLLAKRYHYPDLPMAPFVWAALVITLPVGVLIHILFGTNTTLNYRLGVSRRP